MFNHAYDIFTPEPSSLSPMDTDVFIDHTIHLHLCSFTDLNSLLETSTSRISQPPQKHASGITRAHYQTIQYHRQKSLLEESRVNVFRLKDIENIPPSIRNTIESTHMLDVLMSRAVSHWCCIGFKVAPIRLELIRDWHNAPLPIVYSIAAISLVTFIDHSQQKHSKNKNKNASLFAKGAAMVFYDKARQHMEDVLFEDDLEPNVLQSYFCLSYISNLLRLPDQHRAWASLASIGLLQSASDIKAEREMDEQTIMCWYRWYYIDAWMSLSRNTTCLLPDDILLPRLKEKDTSYSGIPSNPSLSTRDAERAFDRLSLYQFSVMSRYMRRFIRAIHSGDLFDILNDGEGMDTYISPSPLYYELTSQLQSWYDIQPHAFQPRPSFKEIQNSPSSTFNPRIDIHLYLCYHSMRLVLLFQFLHPKHPPSLHIIIDSLETNLILLQALQHLRSIGCDQSTYHLMFFAIHNAAKRVYSYAQTNPEMRFLLSYAKEQLQMNLTILLGTQSFENDIFMLQLYAEKIEHDLQEIGITVDAWDSPKNSSPPGTFVFRLNSQSKKIAQHLNGKVGAKFNDQGAMPTKHQSGKMGKWPERIQGENYQVRTP
ncbi:hypothetical protein CLU79DRAFT_821298 [Phycomyces nitens]|nr:hypothetical protein CLU79DRAFT_821298 [Phycomyces nitens]